MAYSSDNSIVFKKLSQEVGRIHRAALRSASNRRSGKQRDGIKFKVDNKLRGAYGEANMHTGVVRINKKYHKRDSEKLIDTLTHEQMHFDHPKMHEKTVRKLTPKKVKKMKKGEKNKLYAKLK